VGEVGPVGDRRQAGPLRSTGKVISPPALSTTTPYCGHALLILTMTRVTASPSVVAKRVDVGVVRRCLLGQLNDVVDGEWARILRESPARL
jgi:hypothetical protein